MAEYPGMTCLFMMSPKVVPKRILARAHWARGNPSARQKPCGNWANSNAAPQSAVSHPAIEIAARHLAQCILSKSYDLDGSVLPTRHVMPDCAVPHGPLVRRTSPCEDAHHERSPAMCLAADGACITISKSLLVCQRPRTWGPALVRPMQRVQIKTVQSPNT
jgi:hypothetical protein